MNRSTQSNEEPELLITTLEEAGTRIDKLLALRYPKYSRTYFQNLIEMKSVLIDGEPVKKRTIADEGDEIEVIFQATPEASLEPEQIPLDIL